MKKLIVAAALLTSVAAGVLAVSTNSFADDSDGGSVSCLNGPKGTQVQGDGTTADGMVYDATKSKTAAKSATGCTDTMAMNSEDDEDGDTD